MTFLAMSQNDCVDPIFAQETLFFKEIQKNARMWFALANQLRRWGCRVP
jgi:hypothetical protein